MKRLLQNYPKKTRCLECDKAFTIICSAHDASCSFLDIFNTTRKRRRAKGTPTDEEQDLLRAMLAFATAGLDYMLKQLIEDALPVVIESNEGAKAMLKTYTLRMLQRGGGNYEFIAEVLVDPSRSSLVRLLISDLTAGSLQSKEEIMKVASFFDIPSKRISRCAGQLDDIFQARNQIVHEMDVDFGQPNRNRRPRRKGVMIDYTEEIFSLASCVLGEVSSRI